MRNVRLERVMPMQKHELEAHIAVYEDGTLLYTFDDKEWDQFIDTDGGDHGEPEYMFSSLKDLVKYLLDSREKMREAMDILER